MARPSFSRPRIARALATISLAALLTACGGEQGGDREEGPGDRETPSHGAPRDDDEDDDEDD